METASAFAGNNHAASVMSVQVHDVDNVKQVSADVSKVLGNSFTIIDWQSVAVSRFGTSDVARLLCMGMRPEQRRRHERALLRHYHRALCAHGVSDY